MPSSGSPAKKQKVSANANEHLQQDNHKAPAAETDKDPYPQGTDHESRSKHDTTTTHEDEEMEKAKDGGEWRTEPPYRTHDENKTFEKKHTAECNCGRVKYWLSRDKPLASKYCHCKDCQSLHGAPFQWAAIFEKKDLHFENGAKGLAFYHSSKKHTYHDLPCKVSCAYCHAPIMDEGRNMVLMFPAIIKFKDEEAKKGFEPTMHIFYSRRVLDIPDGKPKWSEINDESELMKDLD
ncbi:Mss4-like protein [Xylariales sp. AK1849]|nr:Mss4-like protein [Xylariales sp. AK1849]